MAALPRVAGQQDAGDARLAWSQSMPNGTTADLVAAIGDYQPDDYFCCCLAVQPEIVAIDLDIVDHEARSRRRQAGR